MLGEMSFNFDIPVVSPCGSTVDSDSDLNDDNYYKYIQEDDYEKVIDVIFVNEPTTRQTNTTAIKAECIEDVVSDFSDCTLPYEEETNKIYFDDNFSTIGSPIESLEQDLLKVNGIDIDCFFEGLHDIKCDEEVESFTNSSMPSDFDFSKLRSSSPRLSEEDSNMTIPCMESPVILPELPSLDQCFDSIADIPLIDLPPEEVDVQLPDIEVVVDEHLPDIKVEDLPHLDITCGDLEDEEDFPDDVVVQLTGDEVKPPVLDYVGLHSSRHDSEFELFSPPCPPRSQLDDLDMLTNMDAPPLLTSPTVDSDLPDDVEDFSDHIPALMSPYRMATQELMRSSQFMSSQSYTSRFNQPAQSVRPFGSNTAPSYPSSASRYQRGYHQRNRSNGMNPNGPRSYHSYSRPNVPAGRSNANASNNNNNNNNNNQPPRRHFASHGQSEKDRRREQNRVQRFAESQIRRVKAFQPFLDQYFKRPKPTKVGVLRASIAMMEMFTTSNMEDEILNLRSEVLSLKKKVKEKQHSGVLLSAPINSLS